jgi:predicted RNA-binding Zn ribbon-like protein
VDFGHDTEQALAVVVDLVNSFSPEARYAVDGAPDEQDALAALRGFAERNEVSDLPDLTVEDLRAVRELRERLFAVWLVRSDAEAAALVNDIVAGSRATPRLTDHDGWPLHIHYFAPRASLAEHLAADGGMALAFVLVAGERDRLRRCDAPDCERVLVDLSRNRSRRYCDSRTCGNRLHVAAYRARQRAG